MTRGASITSLTHIKRFLVKWRLRRKIRKSNWLTFIQTIVTSTTFLHNIPEIEHLRFEKDEFIDNENLNLSEFQCYKISSLKIYESSQVVVTK